MEALHLSILALLSFSLLDLFLSSVLYLHLLDKYPMSTPESPCFQTNISANNGRLSLSGLKNCMGYLHFISGYQGNQKFDKLRKILIVGKWWAMAFIGLLSWIPLNHDTWTNLCHKYSYGCFLVSSPNQQFLSICY